MRDYEIEYVSKVRKVIGDDERIELVDVTKNVDKYYAMADVLMSVSLNEVIALPRILLTQ